MQHTLSALGHRIDIATTNDDGPGRRTNFALGEPIQETAAGEVRWYFNKTTDFYKVSFAFQRWLEAHIERYDLLHVHALFSFTSTAAMSIAKRKRIPYVVRPLGTLNRYGLERRRPTLKNVSLRLIERPLLEAAAAIHVTSDAEAQDVRSLGIQTRIVVVPIGVETQSAEPFATTERSFSPARYLFLSRLDPKKNIESLLDAFTRLLRANPSATLTIAGDGDPTYVSQLHAKSAGLGLTSSINWVGHVEGLKKARIFAESTVFVLPSFSENFGIAVVEALSTGLPCVLTDGVAVSVDVAACAAGRIVSTDADSICRGMLEIVENQESWRAMSCRAVELARSRFGLDQMGARLVELYNEVSFASKR
jgi:glycosyltransferase involved in cell wall biosynthesis